MASGPYRPLLESHSLDDIKALADASDLILILMQSTFTYDPDDATVTDLAPGTYELTVSGYSRATIAASAVAYDAGNNRAYIPLTDELFSSLAAGETIGSGVVTSIETDTNDGTRLPLVNIDLSVALPTNGGDVTFDFDAQTIRVA